MASPGCGRPNCQSTDGDADADNGDGRPTCQPLYCGGDGGTDNGDGEYDGDDDR